VSGTQDEQAIIHPLMAEVMTAMLTDTERSTQRVFANYDDLVRRLRAERDAIRDAVLALAESGQFPSHQRLVAAAWPDEDLVASYRTERIW
jgi:hypothetical protein